MTVLALDGGKNIGWALFTDQGEEISRGVVDYRTFFRQDNKGFERSPIGTEVDGFVTWELNGYYFIDTIVVEGIRHNPDIKQGGSQRWESQVEGAARILAVVTSVKVVVQPPDRLSVSLMHEGMEWPRTKTGNKKHLPDDLSAYLHGRYYFRSIGVLQ